MWRLRRLRLLLVVGRLPHLLGSTLSQVRLAPRHGGAFLCAGRADVVLAPGSSVQGGHD